MKNVDQIQKSTLDEIYAHLSSSKLEIQFISFFPFEEKKKFIYRKTAFKSLFAVEIFKSSYP